MSEANEKPKRSRKKSADIPAEVVAAADKEIGKPPKKQKSPPPKSTRKPKKKGPPKRVDAAAEEVLRQERLAEALDYRRMGYSYRQIGEAMGQAASTVYGWVKQALAEMVQEQAEDVKAIEMDRYEYMLQKMMEMFEEQPDPSYMAAILQLSDRRLKMHGVRTVVEDAGDAFAQAFSDKFMESVRADRPILRPDGDVPMVPVL